MLDDGGLFASPCETHDGDGVLLRETLRYAHGEDHVRDGACRRPGSPSRQSRRRLVAQREKSIPVPGLVVVAAKPASTAPSAGR